MRGRAETRIHERRSWPISRAGWAVVSRGAWPWGCFGRGQTGAARAETLARPSSGWRAGVARRSGGWAAAVLAMRARRCLPAGGQQGLEVGAGQRAAMVCIAVAMDGGDAAGGRRWCGVVRTGAGSTAPTRPVNAEPASAVDAKQRQARGVAGGLSARPSDSRRAALLADACQAPGSHRPAALANTSRPFAPPPLPRRRASCYLTSRRLSCHTSLPLPSNLHRSPPRRTALPPPLVCWRTSSDSPQRLFVQDPASLLQSAPPLAPSGTPQRDHDHRCRQSPGPCPACRTSAGRRRGLVEDLCPHRALDVLSPRPDARLSRL